MSTAYVETLDAVDDGPMLLVGTRKGAWMLAGDDTRSSWKVSGAIFLGHIAQHMMLDPRDRKTLLLAMRTGHLGPTVFRSTDLGRSWSEASKPPPVAAGDPLPRSVSA